MKKLFLGAVLFSVALYTEGQVKMPAPSPTQTIKQDFGLGSIEVTYSRPAAKGRKIFGGLEAYNEIWRTGANAATIVKFTDPVEINGKKIDTGSYALYTIPGIDSWVVILNKGISNWGADGYKESDDVARFTIVPKKVKPAVESFTIQFSNVLPTTCNLDIVWENTLVSVPLKTDIRERVRAQIEKAMQGDKKPYWQAAQFYHEYDNNPKKALEYVSEAVKANPQAFWIWLYKARIEQSLGDKAAAMASSKKSLEWAKEANNSDYIKMNEELQKKLK
ncbi:MAG: DUF2911 domain-containing protein [Ferruginibacter sp.]